MNNKFEGQGSLIIKNGIKYVGTWKNGKKTGFGSSFYPNWNVYKGNYLENDIDGVGTLWLTDKEQVFYGQFTKNRRNGWGVHWFADGTKYEGEWKDNLRHGYGLVYKDNQVSE